MSRRLLVSLALVMPGGVAYAQAVAPTSPDSTARPPEHISISDEPIAPDTATTELVPLPRDAELDARIGRIKAERLPPPPSVYTTNIVDVGEPLAPLAGTPTVDR